MLGFGVRLWEGQLRRGGFIPGATLDMNFAAGQFLGAKPSDLTVARATTGYATASSGLLVSFAINTPRWLAGPGLLIEESRTNSILQSNALSNVAWTATTLGVAGSPDVSPAGTANAWRLTASAGNATLKQGVATTAVSWVYSVWLKRVSGTGNVDISLDGVSWVTQTLTSAWQRFNVVQTGVAGTSNPGIRLVVNGDVVDAFGCQAEANNLTGVTSYIPTTAGAVTRALDDVALTGAAFSTPVSGASGVWYAEGVIPSDAGGSQTRRFIDVTDGTANNRIVLGKATTDQGRYLVSVAAASQADIFSVAAYVTGTMRMAARFAANDFQVATNGALGTPDVSGSVPTPTQMQIGIDVGKTALAAANGYIRRVAFIPGIRADAVLQALTA